MRSEEIVESTEHCRWFKTFTLWRKSQIFDSGNKISFWIIEVCVIVIDGQESVLIFSWKKKNLTISLNPWIFWDWGLQVMNSLSYLQIPESRFQSTVSHPWVLVHGHVKLGKNHRNNRADLHFDCLKGSNKWIRKKVIHIKDHLRKIISNTGK